LASEPTTILMIGGGELFPDGTGATARMRAFARGLHLMGVDVRVLLLVSRPPDDWPDPNGPVSGVWRGVPFEYMGGIRHGERGWLSRRIRELRAVGRTFSEILAVSGNGRPTAVVLLGTNLRWILPVAAACRWAGTPLVHDRTEFPFVYDDDGGGPGRLWRWMYEGAVFRLFDGVTVISTHLESYMRTRVRSGAWVLRIPILVEHETFECPGSPVAGLVGYAGSLAHRDELVQLIEAVSIVRRDHPETRLRIIGGGSESQALYLKGVASRFSMGDAIEMPGFARADEVPGLLCECAAMALPRAAGLFSTAGMPTKLGEYLSSGRPVTVTATGDIPMCLHDGVDAFVVEPGDLSAFASALGRALYDPASVAVGLAGSRVARREFDPETHMRRLVASIAGGRGGRRERTDQA